MTRHCFVLFLLGCTAPVSEVQDPPVSTDTVTNPSPEDTSTYLDSGASAPVANAQIEENGAVMCPDASLRSITPFDHQTLPSSENWMTWLWSSGAIAADFDQDSRPEILISDEIRPRLVTWETDHFIDLTNARLPDRDWSYTTGGSSADYDGDGDLDLFVMRHDLPNVLLQNDGTGVFTDVTEDSGLLQLPYRSMASSWGDLDRDGDLDLFVGNYGIVDNQTHLGQEQAHPSELYRNLGDGTFKDISHLLPEPVQLGYTYAGGWHDLNHDGFPELYVVNDFGATSPNQLLWNDGGVLTTDDGTAGLNVATTGMGLGAADVNNDSTLDFLIPAWHEVLLLESVGDLWFETGAIHNIAANQKVDQHVGWGAEFGDIDNDGDLDIVVAFGYIDLGDERWYNPYAQPDALYVQDDEGMFEDRGSHFGLDDASSSRGFILADLDGNGWLDILKPSIDGDTHVYMSRCGNDGWLKIRLLTNSHNSHAIGAKVRIRIGSVQQERVIRAGGTNLASASPAEALFGIASKDIVDHLEVIWPDGAKSNFTDIPAHQLVTIRRL